MFQPQIPMPGVAGWRFLERTLETQKAAFENSPQLDRQIEYFVENIGNVKEPADLLSDHRLLEFSLKAFGLESELGKNALIRKVLEEGSESDDALANRMNVAGYVNMAKTFGFGDAGGGQTENPGFVAEMVANFKERAFETAVGETRSNMRFAMNFRREIAVLAAGDGKSWYNILGSTPLRKVFQGAFGLPESFINIDIDRQAAIMEKRADAMFGETSLSLFQDPANVEKMIDRFLVRAQVTDGPPATGPAASALTLLSNRNSNASAGILNLLYGH